MLSLAWTQLLQPHLGKKVVGPLLTLLGAVKKPGELWAGSDESGKGDYLGPLCVAAVILDEIGAKKLLALGVRDSKTLSDAKIRRLAPQVYAIAKSKCRGRPYAPAVQRGI